MSDLPQKKRITFWEALQSHPPYYVRMLAKSAPTTAISDAEVAIASGIDINRVREIKCMLTWDDVTFREVLAFTAACNFDPTSNKDRMRAKQYDKKCQIRQAMPFQYLKIHPKYESEFLPLIRILKAQLQRASSAA